ncbi:hypothetical protein Moror_11783 [Moniliophthora roreri MCA 2997]|uniref:Uncharacterized protein n=1 Tax=Moniliophthora roreri (strain MCA 2997) TaxID=1381753 RepID=V2W837_MONRO|nr:hypothetical protein Moror_11783 [Moniliophthora roreri MCA 2997]
MQLTHQREKWVSQHIDAKIRSCSLPSCRRVTGVALHPAWAEKYRVESQITGNERSSSWMYSPVTGGWVYMRHESLLSVEQSLSATFSNLLLDVTP